MPLHRHLRRARPAPGALVQGLESRTLLAAAPPGAEPVPGAEPAVLTSMTAEALCNEKVTVLFPSFISMADGYEVQRAASASGPFTTVGTTAVPPDLGTTVTFVDRASPTNVLAPQTTYYYRARFYTAGGPGGANSPVAVTTTSPDTASTSLTLNGSAQLVRVPATLDDDGAAVRLTDNVNQQTGSAFRTEGRPVNRDFTTEFTFLIPEHTTTPADGFAFVIQSDSAHALGGGAGGLGYEGLPNSLAVKFDTFAPGGAINQTGVYVNGAMDDAGSDLGFDLANGHRYKATIAYDADASGDGDELTLRVEDIEDPTVVFLQTFTADNAGNPFDMDAIVGGDCAFVGFTGATGGWNQEQLILDWTFPPDFDPPPPLLSHVTQVFVNGPGLTSTNPTPNQIAFRTLAGIDATYGYRVPDGPNQLKTVPWIGGVNQVALRFDRSVAGSIDSGDLSVRGLNTPTYTPTDFRYDAATTTAVWTLPAPVVNDKLRLFLDDAGVPSLDGEWSSGADAYPSGDGRIGGDFNFRVNVLGGDATQDGVVNALDLAYIRQRLNRPATNPGASATAYTPFADITADGAVNALDLSAARQRLNRRLPPGTDPAATALLLQ